MNAAQYRRLESQLSSAEEFFLEQENLPDMAKELREQLRGLLQKVVAARIRAEETERRAPGSRRPW